MQIQVLLLGQVELLGAQHGAGAGDADPANESLSIDLEVFHGVEADKSASSAEASLAVDGDGTSARSSEVLLARVHELLNDGVRRRAPIREHHILMVDTLLQEAVTIILSLVESDDLGDVEMLEDVDVAGGGVAVAVDGVALVDRAHEGEELAGDDPVQIAVLHLFVVLVLARIKRFEVVPSKLDGLLETLEAVLNRAVVVAVTAAGISERTQVGVVLLELAVGLLGIHLEDDDHECAHQVG